MNSTKSMAYLPFGAPFTVLHRKGGSFQKRAGNPVCTIYFDDFPGRRLQFVTDTEFASESADLFTLFVIPKLSEFGQRLLPRWQ
jgi:hypothetical protein